LELLLLEKLVVSFSSALQRKVSREKVVLSGFSAAFAMKM
jgi:hypothetical protein